MTLYTYEDSAMVQLFLDNLQPEESFTVVFMTQSDEQRRYTGTLVPSDKRSHLVAMRTTEGGFKKFSLDRVLWIDRA